MTGQSCWHPDTDTWARGIGWFDWQVRVPGSENERVTLWFSEVAKGRGGEGAVGVDGLKALRREITEGWHHYAHDMAWRGVHCDAGYALDLMPFVKVTRDREGKPKSGLVGLVTVEHARVTRNHKVFALDGAAGIEGMVNGKGIFVALLPVSPRRDASNPTADGQIRYYGEYRVPAHPALPAYLHGREVRLRLDGYRKGVNVSDCLSVP